MKKQLLFLPLLLLAMLPLNAQVVNRVYGDTVKLTSLAGDGKANLVIDNNTKNIKGFLYNNGKGVTIFKHGAIKLDDSTYIIGGDTLHTKSDQASKILPAGLNDQSWYAAADGSNQAVAKYNVFVGNVTYTQAQLDSAKNTFISQKRVFNKSLSIVSGGTKANQQVQVINDSINAVPQSSLSWSHDSIKAQLNSTFNTGSYIYKLATNTPATKYAITSTPSARYNLDNDRVGILIAEVSDPATLRPNAAFGYDPVIYPNINTTDSLVPAQHTLSVFRSRSSLTAQYFVILDAGLSTQRTVADGTSSLIYKPLTNWKSDTTEFDISVNRNGDTIKIFTTEYADRPGGKGALGHEIDILLTSAPDLLKFRAPSFFGFAAQSQAYAYWKNFSYINPDNYIIDLFNKEVWSPNDAGVYSVVPGISPHDVIGKAHLFYNPATSVLGITQPVDTFYILNEQHPIYNVANADSLGHISANGYLLKSDTATMLTPYLRKADTTSMLNKIDLQRVIRNGPNLTQNNTIDAGSNDLTFRAYTFNINASNAINLNASTNVNYLTVKNQDAFGIYNSTVGSNIRTTIFHALGSGNFNTFTIQDRSGTAAYLDDLNNVANADSLGHVAASKYLLKADTATAVVTPNKLLSLDIRYNTEKVLTINRSSVPAFFGDSYWLYSTSFGKISAQSKMSTDIIRSIAGFTNNYQNWSNGGKGVVYGVYQAYKNLPTPNTRTNFLQLGHNDISYYPNYNAAAETVKQGIDAFITNSFLASATPANDVSVTYTGTWNEMRPGETDSSVLKAHRIGGNALVTTAAGATASFTITGNNVVIGSIMSTGYTLPLDSFSVQYDTFPAKKYCFNGKRVPGNFETAVYDSDRCSAVIVLQNLGPGTHTVTLTKDNNAGKALVFDYYGLLADPTTCNPVFVGGITTFSDFALEQSRTNYGTHFDNKTIDTLNIQVRDVIKEYSGYPVSFVNVNNYLINNSTNFSPLNTAGVPDGHPNDTGQLMIAYAYLAQMGNSILSPAAGGTGINNGLKTITYGGNLVLGTNNITLTTTGTTSLTLPTSGTLATTAGSQTLTNKTISGSNNTITNIANASLATMAANTVKGSITGTGAPVDLTATQLTTLVNAFTSSLSGAVPASGGGTTNFLSADGTWQNPVANYLPLSGGTLSGALILNGNTINGSAVGSTILRSYSNSNNSSITWSEYNYYGGTGGDTWNLPTISGNLGKLLIVQNQGSGNLTVAIAVASSDDIYNSSSVTSVVITPGQTVRFHNNSLHWSAN